MIHLGLPFSAIPWNMPMRLDMNLATALGSELMKNVARRQFSRTLLTLLLMQCSAMPALAQERSVSGADAQIGVPASLSRSAIDGEVLANARGRVSINVSAGFVNAQSNNAALAASSGSANAVATANVRVDAVPGMPGNSSALMAGNAFAGARLVRTYGNPPTGPFVLLDLVSRLRAGRGGPPPAARSRHTGRR